tara:strand:- start:20089 stop:21381 length:1293 start_codon:yes stop_codon:yes gene_type:complete
VALKSAAGALLSSMKLTGMKVYMAVKWKWLSRSAGEWLSRALWAKPEISGLGCSRASASLGIVLAVLIVSPSIKAEVVGQLYQQSELVTGQSQAERKQAAQSALEKVLVRVSGRDFVLQENGVQTALKRAERFIEAYRYESTDETVQQEGLAVAASRLIFNFSRAGVEQLLRDQQAPLWPSNRPSVLVWLVKDDLNQGRELVSLQDGSPLAKAAAELSQLRGIPLVMPMLDLEDRLQINPNQIWGLDQAAIIEASARYNADVLLVGRYSQTSSGQWLSAWTLLHKQHQQVFDSEATDEPMLVTQGLNDATDFLASIYSIGSFGGATDSVIVQVEQVNGFRDYVKAINYLDSLEVVRHVNLAALKAQSIQLSVKLEGDITALTDALALDRRLGALGESIEATPAAMNGVKLPATAEPLGSQGNPLRYRWPG